ncbi:MAG: OsmC family protein [Holophagales bacterium]|nr:MAG: OsmC family protein [Holophagales bacterium]
MEITVSFPGGVAVAAQLPAHVVLTDQPAPLGEGSAPSPFDLFLASLATCAGFYALRFCQQREIPTDGMRLSLATERDPTSKRLAKIGIVLDLPAGFPERYREAVIRAMDQCAVKKAIVDPPAFDVVARPA